MDFNIYCTTLVQERAVVVLPRPLEVFLALGMGVSCLQQKLLY